MSDLTKSADARLANGMNANHMSALIGFESGAADAVYLDANGVFQKASTAATYTGNTGVIAFDGLTAKAYPSGTPADVYGRGSEWFYADSGLAGVSQYWVGTAGKLADAKVGSATDLPVAQSVNNGDKTVGTNIVLIRGC